MTLKPSAARMSKQLTARSTRKSEWVYLFSLPFLIHVFSRDKHCLLVRSLAMTASNSYNARPVPTANTLSCDVIVIGGGSAGLTAAKLSGGTLQKECILIEADRVGGDCTWTGCVPSKSLISVAKKMHFAQQRLGSFGQSVTPNFSEVHAYINANIQQIYIEDDSPEALAKCGNIRVIQGKAVLQSQKSVTIHNSNEYEYPNKALTIVAREGIILCTGAAPRVPLIDGLDTLVRKYWTYETIWDQLSQELPHRIVVVGGGPIGCELAQALSRLGSVVTLVTSQRLLPREDLAASNVLESVFVKEGICIVRGRALSVSSDSTGRTVVHCDRGEEIVCDQLLVATGRVPRCRDMNLDGVGIELTHDRSAIHVDDNLQTSLKGIYAAGDCTGAPQFTHLAGYQGAIAARNILLPLSDPGVLESVPATTFTSPEVASVGLSHQQAISKYGMDRVGVLERHLSNVDRAVCDGTQDGFIKIVYLRRSNKVVGATIVAPVAGELISEMAVIIKTGMPLDKLATVMHPYPTYAFALQLMAADLYYEKTLKYKWLFDILKKLGL